jgi:hypothetical protein
MKMHNEELHKFILFARYSYNGDVNEGGLDRTFSTHTNSQAHGVLEGKSEEKRPLVSLR